MAERLFTAQEILDAMHELHADPIWASARPTLRTAWKHLDGKLDLTDDGNAEFTDRGWRVGDTKKSRRERRQQ